MRALSYKKYNKRIKDFLVFVKDNDELKSEFLRIFKPKASHKKPATVVEDASIEQQVFVLSELKMMGALSNHGEKKLKKLKDVI